MIQPLLIACLLALQINTPYCSCVPPPAMSDQQYDEYDLIVKGKIVSLSVKNGSRIISVHVITSYKGNSDKKLVIIKCPEQSGECGIFPKIDEQWLFYAYTNKNTFTTHLCTRTRTMNPKAWGYNEEALKDDLEFLEKKTKKSAQAVNVEEGLPMSIHHR